MPLKSCPYCGRIHAKTYDCGRIPKRQRDKGTVEASFRSTRAWTKASIRIRERDRYMCVYCYKTTGTVTTDDIEVHHIIPIKADYNQRLDGSNLLSLCRLHHEEAEQGLIRKDVLLSMAREQEEASQSGLPAL